MSGTEGADIESLSTSQEKTHHVAMVGFDFLNLNWLAPASG
jgi:hypothetical protein